VKKVISCGVIGYGPACNHGNYHINTINLTPGLEAVAVCDTDSSRLEVAKNDFPGIKTYQSVSELLNNDNIDLVVVVTPHNTHERITIQCLNAGKHTIIEKPMAITTEEATSMIEVAQKRNVMLSVFHNRRYDKEFLAVKDVISKGQIGDVFRIDLYQGGYNHPGTGWRSNKDVSGGSLYDMGAHFIDWILNLVPEDIDSITGFTQKVQWWDVTNEDEIESIIKFKNGAIVNIQISSVSSVPKPNWRVLGSKGGILYEGQGVLKVFTRDGDLEEIELKDRQSNWGDYYVNIAEHLLSGGPLGVTPESARRVISVIETTGKSALSGKAEQPLFR